MGQDMNMTLSNRWHNYFFGVAKLAAGMSKDPRHKVGCVIIKPFLKHPVGTGYNGFPRGIDDSPERYADRELKLQMVLHAEVNAILDAGNDCRGAVLYCTTIPCPQCAALIIQSGIVHVIALEHPSDERYVERIALVERMFAEVGIAFTLTKEEPNE